MFSDKPFLQYLNFTQKALIKQSFYLLKWAESNKDKLADYSFLVMPAAKAYEGFLKQLFFDLKLISKENLSNDHFRVGMALNPELEQVERLRHKCLYNEICQECGEETAQMLWQTWKKCRNRLFHYFPQLQQVFTLKEAEERLREIVKAIDLAYQSCLKYY
ncbi:hypothetical protein COT75_05120 [Candidatus Beckwithbacteria bacterium CG10_big_fil_rev_8_21_14_0_10_34_10]|uniref:HEPN domain-containing protein n=1 Tax=Candidatus Beckwithbacteria bacterium CG10_big_fil_rev_8_21_14_0_10_34_10 TaxID=1974495 RepID=A0A2H0W837_9BACT|nr:MAG: hypothetical protein COT75_05120 [Candidatus Beckwithbacteria bacterium CG10_big_fil_rev_8_21_14_0_10_34_10]